MNGRKSRWQPGWALALLVAGIGGCEADPPAPVREPAPPPVLAGARFDAATAGTVRGRVVWDGDPPRVPPFRARLSVPPTITVPPKLVLENPNAPRIDPRSRGVRDAVVFLRGVDPGRGKPWDLPPVRVEQRGWRIDVLQGAGPSRVGFVRRGESLEMVSRDRVFHALHAGGAAFFTLTFPDPDRPLTRRLADKGLVELSSGAGYSWMRAYLFVDDHPYFARTDADGRFTLTGVPPGRYELVCRHPDWHERGHDRDPETGLVTRRYFAPPVELKKPIVLGPKQVRAVDFRLTATDFGKE